MIDREAAKFTCDMCGDTFDKGRSDEEALAETESYFGNLPEDDLAVVCAGCWNKIHPQRN